MRKARKKRPKETNPPLYDADWSRSVSKELIEKYVRATDFLRQLIPDLFRIMPLYLNRNHANWAIIKACIQYAGRGIDKGRIHEGTIQMYSMKPLKFVDIYADSVTEELTELREWLKLIS